MAVSIDLQLAKYDEAERRFLAELAKLRKMLLASEDNKELDHQQQIVEATFSHFLDMTVVLGKNA